jgi:hypothetical protein
MPHKPLSQSHFTLDTSGVAGFFGGDEAIYAMATVNIYPGRRWLGWYNSPGSYTVAKKYGQIAHSGIWDGLFPGITVDPAILFELSGSSGPGFIGAHSGTIIDDTGHIGHLLMKECESVPNDPAYWVPGRTNSALMVTIATLGDEPEYKMNTQLPHPNTIHLAIIPILTSLATCALCGVYEDWYCFSMILLGIITSGLACFVIGSAKLYFIHPKPAPGCPMGDGMMTGKEMVILLGVEGAVNSVTRGRFSLVFIDNPHHRNVGICAFFLIIQFVAQLLLIPQGSLFGQIMFLGSLAVSWVYNCYLSSTDREKLQREMLRKIVLPQMKLTKYRLGTRTTMVVFVLLVLRPSNLEKLLNALLPNDTNTWNIWKRVVLEKMEGKKPLSFDDGDHEGVDSREKELLENLYQDAEAAYNGFLKLVPGKSDNIEKVA